MTKSKLESEASQTALANSRPLETEFSTPSNVEPINTSALEGVAKPIASDAPIDELDGKLLTQLDAAILKSGRIVKLDQFEFRSNKDLVGYPGGAYLNWTIVFTSKVTRRTLRSDAFVAPRNDFYVLIGELESISR